MKFLAKEFGGDGGVNLPFLIQETRINGEGRIRAGAPLLGFVFAFVLFFFGLGFGVVDFYGVFSRVDLSLSFGFLAFAGFIFLLFVDCQSLRIIKLE